MTQTFFPSLILTFLLGSMCAFADESNPTGTTEIPAPPVTDTSSLEPVSETDLSFPSDTLMIHTNGAKMAYEISKNEFFLKDKLTKESNIEALASEFATAEEMRQYVHSLDSAWGQDCMMVLYKPGMPHTEENRSLLTSKIEIKLDPEVASMHLLNELAAAVGVEVLSDEIGASGSAALQATCGGSAVRAAEILSRHESVVRARPIVTYQLVQTSVPPGPNDPFYTPSNQYYIHHEYTLPDQILVWPVWCGGTADYKLAQRYFGRGVEINILDDGIQGQHPELDRNYVYRKDEDFVDGDNDGGPDNFQDNHGTEMAGVIAARQNNGIGITGIAPAAEIYSSRVFGASTDPEILANAHEHEASTVGVISLGFVPGGNYTDISELLEDAFEKMAEDKEVPITYPAGGSPDGARMDYDRAVSHRYTICTAGWDAPSEEGANIVTTAPGFELTTTDRTGDDGDQEDSDYMFDFTGTSPASAQTTGVVALMQDARPDLGWRDYQEILLLTSVDFHVTVSPREISSSFYIAEDTTFTPFGPLPWQHSYLYGAGMMNGFAAVALAELWAPLPDSAALYKVVSVREQISEDLGATVTLLPDGNYEIENVARTFLFDFNRIVPSKQNLRIEHVELNLVWEEPPVGAPAELLPTFAFICSPYYTNGPSNPEWDQENLGTNVDDRPRARSNLINDLSYGALMSEEDTDINAPVEWTYTTNRFWGLINTGGYPGGPPGFDPDGRIGVPDQDLRPGDINQTEVIGPGVWELDVGIQASVVVDERDFFLPNHPDSILSRRLVEATITMYGTENNTPPTVTSSILQTSGNPGTVNPRTAFADEDITISGVSFFDPEGDNLTVSYVWQILGADGLTWENLPIPAGFTSGLCEYDEIMVIETKPSTAGNVYDRYFVLYQPDGTSVAYYFAEAGSFFPPAGAVAAADRVVPINGVEIEEGAGGVAADIATAINSDPLNLQGDGLTPIYTAVVDVDTNFVTVNYPIGTGDVINGSPGTSNMVVRRGVANPNGDVTDPSALIGNCYGTSSARLDSSVTVAGNKYRALIIPRDGLRVGFRAISPEIIVNSRPILLAAHSVPYFYDADLWIETVPPEDLPPFAFFNEMSQGTGDTTTNQEWVELIVNFTTDLRGFKITNDIASFDLTFTDHEIWQEVEYGTIIVIYNGEQRDPIIPPDTPMSDFFETKRWIIPSSNPDLFKLPANGDGWGEFSNIDCTPESKTCDGAHVGFLSPFAARDAVHGVSINGNLSFVDAGVAGSGQAVFFDGALTLSDPNDPDSQMVFNPTESADWAVEAATDATPGTTNSVNNTAILDFIDSEMKTSVPSYRFYPGDGTQVVIDPVSGARSDPAEPDLVPSDLVPGLRIDRRTGVVSGRPDVPDGGHFIIKIQRFHSFSSEIQIYELDVSEAPRLVDTDDEDNDGLINLLEEALGGDYYAAETNILPTGQIVTDGGMSYPSISFRRLAGGTWDPSTGTYVFENLLYTVEGSPDLQGWLSAPDFVVEEVSVVEDFDNPDIEVVTLRVMDSIGSMMLGDRYYLRLSVTRLP